MKNQTKMESWQVLALPGDLAEIMADSQERTIAKKRGTRYRGPVLIYSRRNKKHPIGAILAKAMLTDVEKKGDQVFDWTFKKIEKMIETPIDITGTFVNVQLEAGVIDMMRLPKSEEQIKEDSKKNIDRLLKGEDPVQVYEFSKEQEHKIQQLIDWHYEKKMRRTRILVATLLAVTIAIGVFHFFKIMGIL